MTDGGPFRASRIPLSAIPCPLAVVEAQSVRAANEAFARLVGGRSAEDLVGLEPANLAVEADRGRLVTEIGRGLARRRVEPFDVGLIRFDGSIVRARVTISLLDDGDERRVLMGVHDVTQQRNMEARLAQSERAATLGMLVAGVAHEINNPLAYALGSIDIGIRKLAADQPDPDRDISTALNQCFRNAHDGIDRIRLIVRDLLNLSRPPSEHEMGVEVEAVLDSAVNLAWNEIRHRARVVKVYAGVPLVPGDSVRLGQVFLNLLVNAAQSIPDGSAMDAEIRLVTSSTADEVAVEVHDTGVGMPPEVVGRVFEPFFTTKGDGVGTGLGLSICREIVDALGGTLSVSSELGKGSCFRVVLPRAQVQKSEDDTPREAWVPPPSPFARVLVVDDEPLLGHTLRLALEGRHEVVVVSSGREALACLEHDSAFDAVLCDLMMPDISGVALHAAIRERHPALVDRFVFMTGGAFTADARAFLDGYDGPTLEKPFDVKQLEELLARVIQQRP